MNLVVKKLNIIILNTIDIVYISFNSSRHNGLLTEKVKKKK